MATEEDRPFYLEKKELELDDSDEEFQYEEVPIDEDFDADFDEDLSTAVRTIQEAVEDDIATARKPSGRPKVEQRPEVTDDFVRNFLVKMNMERSLDTFQTEWYELQQKGLLNEEDVGTVPDIYVRNQRLDNEVKFLRKECDKFKNAAQKAMESFVKLRKERDYHRMHHKRVVQEKNKVITDIKRLKSHYSSYEPTLRHLKTKYETAMKEKMLTKLERDRVLGQVTGLQSTLKNIEAYRGVPVSGGTDGLQSANTKPVCQRGREILVDGEGRGPTQRQIVQERMKSRDVTQLPPPSKHPDDSEYPPDTGVNPNLALVKGPPGHLTRSGGFRQATLFQAHKAAVSSVALHPRKQVLATTSDDHSWKLWSIPSGEVIMTGEGHTDWIAGSDFHPGGGQLATCSGDTTVKIWDFSEAQCVHTFLDHTHAVWGVSWHSCGDFVASCSMDNMSKIWDLNSLRCRNTLRGHADSVNSIEFLPYSNTVCTASADKTVSMWDIRTGLCAHTFYGHMHSVNHCTFNIKGTTIASCDSYGMVTLWDCRTSAPMTTIDVGPHPANHVAFDSSGSLLAISNNDSTVKLYEVANAQIKELIGHEDAVQASVFDRNGEFLVSCSSDMTVRIWS